MRHLIENAIYPQPQNFNEAALRLTHQPLFMRLQEHHCLASSSSSSSSEHIPFPQQQREVNDDTSAYSDPSLRNAWFPGDLGGVSFAEQYTPTTPDYSRLYPGGGRQEGKKQVLVTVEGHTPPNTRNARTRTREEEERGWTYQTYTRPRSRQSPSQGQSSSSPPQSDHPHEHEHHCSKCQDRDLLLRKAKLLDARDHAFISQKYEEEEWRVVERMFENVGLGRDEVRPDEDSEGEDEDEDEDEDSDMEDAAEDEGEDEGEGEDPEFLADPNADFDSTTITGKTTMTPTLLPLRRATDRVKMEECDGIRDIIFSGDVRSLSSSLSFPGS